MFSTANSSSEGRLKSEHAKLRLFQRQIAETSVEQVIEKGKKVHQTFFRDLRCDRFKHIFEGQVVVTERKDGSVVTTYVVLPPLSPIYIDPPTSDAHMRRSRHLSVYPERATAHTIFVIDSSASMNACDVSDAKTRWERGFRAIATDFIAERICQGTRQDTDVFSMITFSAPKGVVPPQSAQELHYQLRSYAQVVFERQPQDPLLINRVVDAYRNLKVQSHGMYLPGHFAVATS
uniref:VWFA domain-containing protein n=1 Tax=Chromera velia CCMP2878 TaxID=1169474 RepID=A0A0G4HI64_9ALVE|eukprot:Cvel_6955.t1-p1 / transcript=Cvel_6955.t1 / gene=Cvel_6955 / organism=Chromera_velia_CCMP2878 / gene_product=hypothetical protein / transcript_product=hypothetical protein / location=Cvel_scaffold352:83653-84351(-) / protein_length=233 / sequence_SO=supercontig / SO=protein_coding / is_pseudo=false